MAFAPKYLNNANIPKILTRQPNRRNSALPPSRHPSLPSDGQIPTGHASYPLHRSCNSILQARSYSILLRLVCSNSCVLWWNIWLRLLRLDPLLLTPQAVSRLCLYTASRMATDCYTGSPRSTDSSRSTTSSTTTRTSRRVSVSPAASGIQSSEPSLACQ